jgi:hypothetical protein
MVMDMPVQFLLHALGKIFRHNFIAALPEKFIKTIQHHGDIAVF